MRQNRTIRVFEHDRLYVGEQGLDQQQLDALWKLNEYHDFSYFEPIARGIKFTQHVGIIQVDGLNIEIHPKSDKDDDSGKWKNVLLVMVLACG